MAGRQTQRGGGKMDHAKRGKFEFQRGGYSRYAGSTSGNDSESTASSWSNFRGIEHTLFGPPPAPEKIENVLAHLKKDPKYDTIQPFRRAGTFCPWYVKDLLTFPSKVQTFKLVSIYERSVGDNAQEDEEPECSAADISMAEKAQKL